jgi:hypothetical protein
MGTLISESGQRPSSGNPNDLPRCGSSTNGQALVGFSGLTSELTRPHRSSSFLRNNDQFYAYLLKSQQLDQILVLRSLIERYTRWGN